MVTDILQPTHLLFILVVALLVLGPKRLPEVARTLGNGLRDFRSAISGEADERPGQSGHYLTTDESESDHIDRPAGPPPGTVAPPAPTDAPPTATDAPPTASDPPPTASAPPPATQEPAPTPPPTEEQTAPTERHAVPPHDSPGSQPA
jgi:TatA/E family protein of Tat protein translocase